MPFALTAVLSFVIASGFASVRGDVILNVEDFDDAQVMDFILTDIEEIVRGPLLFNQFNVVVAQNFVVQQEEQPTPDSAPEKPATSAENEDDAPATDAEPKEEEIDPRIIRMHLSDGSIISGKLAITTLAIDTRFGRLDVPIEEIRYIKPGIDSRPQLKEQVQSWIELIGSSDAEQRKAASAQLVKLGTGVLQLLRPLVHDASATRAAEARAIIERISEELDMEMVNPADFSTQDVIATKAFTITGRIVPQSFALASDFGDLKMPLADVMKADRNTGEPEEHRKVVSINQTNFVSRSMKTTGIRVSKGDRIVIKASGQLSMTRWGNAIATPDGASNTGWYLSGKIYNGAVCMRIGNSGQITKVGSNLSVSAPESGILYLGIAMNPRYAADNYQYPGQFKVDVRVKPKTP